MNQLTSFLIILLAFIAWNFYIIKVKNRAVNHATQELIRTVCWVLLASIYETNWRDWVVYLLSYYAAFWFPFNTVLNKLRRKAWNYVGSGPGAAVTDQFIAQYPGLYPISILLMIAGFGTMIFGTFFSQ